MAVKKAVVSAPLDVHLAMRINRRKYPTITPITSEELISMAKIHFEYQVSEVGVQLPVELIE